MLDPGFLFWKIIIDALVIEVGTWIWGRPWSCCNVLKLLRKVSGFSKPILSFSDMNILARRNAFISPSLY